MKDQNRCIIHDTYPRDDEPCWACVIQFGEEKLHDLLEDAIIAANITVNIKRRIDE